ncbi:proline rich protein 5MeD, partial [Fusarium tricinctum]
LNALGYNSLDNFLYAMVQDATGSQVIRIGGDGSYTLLSTRTSDPNVQMGDIDNMGRYWISNQGKAWWCIDLKPGSATYGKILMSGTAVTTGGIADWAFVPGGGDFMYGIMYDSAGLTGTLSRFSRTAYTWSSVRAYGMVTGTNVFGAVYASADGNLYGSENSNGNIYKFPIAPSVGAPVFVATGPPSTWNDGARCINATNLSV